jgi:hypothetical protein
MRSHLAGYLLDVSRILKNFKEHPAELWGTPITANDRVSVRLIPFIYFLFLLNDREKWRSRPRVGLPEMRSLQISTGAEASKASAYLPRKYARSCLHDVNSLIPRAERTILCVLVSRVPNIDRAETRCFALINERERERERERGGGEREREGVREDRTSGKSATSMRRAGSRESLGGERDACASEVIEWTENRSRSCSSRVYSGWINPAMRSIIVVDRPGSRAKILKVSRPIRVSAINTALNAHEARRERVGEGVAGSRVGMQLSRFALYLILPPKVSTCKSKVPPRISNNRISRRQIAVPGSCAVPRRFIRIHVIRPITRCLDTKSRQTALCARLPKPSFSRFSADCYIVTQEHTNRYEG